MKWNKLYRVLLLTVSMVLSVIAEGKSQEFECNGIMYRVMDVGKRTCATVGRTTNDSEVVVPAVVSYGNIDYTVTMIGRMTFIGAYIEEVTLPNTVTKIDNRGFSYCYNLKTVHLPESLVEIGDSAFFVAKDEDFEWYVMWHNKITNYNKYSTVRIPDGVRKIGKAAFMRGISWRGVNMTPANIPASLEEIEDFAFYNNTPENATLPAGLKKIGNSAFYYFTTDFIKIPDNVTSIGEQAFCKSELERISLPSSLREIGREAFRNSGLTYVRIPDGVTTIGASVFAETPLSEVTFPNTVTEIGDSAFLDCNLVTVFLPASLEKINHSSFRRNKVLSRVSFPEKLISIGNYAFFNCPMLSDVQFPQKLDSIGNYAFSYGSLSEVDIPETVGFLGEGVFSHNSTLNKVTLPDGMKEIPISLFSGCTGLRSLSTHSFKDTTTDGHIIIPKGIEAIGASAFTGCDSIKAVSIPANVSTIGYNPFKGCRNLESIIVDVGNSHYRVEDCALLTMRGDTLISFPGAFKGHYRIPSSVEKIWIDAFYSVSGLTRLTMDDGVKNIGYQAFAKCTQLKNPVLSKSLERIEYGAFDEVEFTDIILPRSLRWIKYGFGKYSDIPDVTHFKSLRIYGTFDCVVKPVSNSSFDEIYYLSEEVQGNSGLSYAEDAISWGSITQDDPILYVLEETYDEIVNGNYYPWSQFKDIRIYDPSDDPYFTSVKQMENDIDTSLPVEVYTLSGIRVADSTENLPSGLYIVRQESKTKKIMIK